MLHEFEKRRLIALAQDGDIEARNELALADMPLVKSRAERYRYSTAAAWKLDYEDLIQAGFMGIMRAVELFDLCLTVRFSFYATQWIDARMRRCLIAAYQMRVPEHVMTKRNKGLLGYSEKARVEKFTGLAYYADVPKQDHIVMKTTPDHVPAIMWRDEADRVLGIIKDLPRNQREVLELRLRGFTHRACGEALGRHYSTIQKRERQGIDMIQRYFGLPATESRKTAG